MLTESDKTLIKNELWYRGEPLFELHKEQRELLKLITGKASFLTVINCARQFGKTYFAVLLSFMHCLQKPNNVVKYGSAFYTDLEKYIFPTIKKIVELMPAEARPEVIESKKLVKFYNGSVIDIVGLDLKPDGLRGNSVSLVIVEEAGYVKRLRYIYFDVVVPMFTHTQRLNPKCIMIGTPSGDLTHDFTNFFFPKAQRENVYFHKTIDDNPLLKNQEKQRIIDEYIKDCSTPEELAIQTATMRRELYGEVTRDLSKAIIPEWKDDYVEDLERDEYFQYYHRYTAMDYGVNDKTVFLFYYYDFKKACVVFEGEFVDSGSSMTTDSLYSNVKMKEHDLYEDKIYRRVADTTNLLLINDFTQKYKMPFIHVKKDLLHVMVNEARLWIKSGRVRVSYKCHELWNCLKNGQWNDEKTAFDHSDMWGHYDALAAFIYALRVIDQQTNPIPVTHGMTGDVQIVKKPQAMQNFRSAFGRKV